MVISSTRRWRAIATAYLLGAVVFLWPMPAAIGSQIWGDRFDAWTTLWLIGHLGERLATFDFSTTTIEILYPIGYNLWSFGHVALQAIGGAIVALGIPVVVSYNLLLIFAVWSSAMAAHLLGREITGSHLAGGAAGVVFSTSPYFYAEGAAGCIELVAAGLLPLYAWALIRLVRDPSWHRCAAATLILAIIGPFNWYYTLFAGLFGLAFCVWRGLALVVRPTADGTPRRAIALILISMGVAALIDAPLIAQAKRETPTRPAISTALWGLRRLVATGLVKVRPPSADSDRQTKPPTSPLRM